MIAALLSLLCVGIAYGLLGWHLSAYHIGLVLGSSFAALMLMILLFWGEKVTKRMFRLGPQGGRVYAHPQWHYYDGCCRLRSLWPDCRTFCNPSFGTPRTTVFWTQSTVNTFTDGCLVNQHS